MTGGRPGRRCSICGHEQVAAINAALAEGQQALGIAIEYKVSPDALSRHRINHLPHAALGESPAQVLLGEGSTDLLGRLADLQARVLVLLRRAERARDLRGSLACVHEATGLLTLHGRLSGLIRPDGAVVNVGVLTGSDDRNVAATRERIAGKLAALARSPATIADAA